MVAILIVWVLSPIVLIPLTIWALASRKKLERFIGQLLYEKRISVSEYSRKQTEKTLTGQSSLPMPYYPAGGGSGSAPDEPSGTFVGPPVPVELLQKRRQQAQAAADQAQLDAVRDVSLRITGEAAAPVPEAAETAAGVSLEKAEIAQPAAEAVTETAAAQAETIEPAAEAVTEPAAAQAETIESAAEAITEPASAQAETIEPAAEAITEPAAAQAETVQPAAGIFGSFIGPPIPPELIAQRRAMSAAAGAAQPKPAQRGWQGEMTPLPAPKKKHTINPASAMLVIGSALVVIAGMIFSTAKWNDMSNWQRTGVIALMAAFFFGLSAVAHKKLKLENTGMAFYMLGSVFTAITFVTVGYFGLLGSWLSVKGGGFWLLYSFAALLITVFSAGAVKLYKKGAFVHAALYGGLCSFTLMSVQIFDGSPDMWALFLNIIAAVPIFLLYKQKLRFGSEMYDDQLKLFTIVLSVIYFVAALPFMIANLDGGWTLPCFLTMLVWIGQAVAYGLLLDSDALRHIHPMLVVITLTELAVSIPGIAKETRLLVFGISIFLAATVYRYVSQIRTRLSDILFPAVLLFSLFTANNVAHREGQLAVCTGLLMGIFLMQSITKDKTEMSRGFTVMLPFSVLIADYGLSELLKHSFDLTLVPSLFISASVMFAAAMVFTFVKPVRTVLSDAVFPISMLVTYSCCASFYDSGSDAVMTFFAAVMLLAVIAVHACEDHTKRMVGHFKYVLPFSAAIFGQGIAVLFGWYTNARGSAFAFTVGCTIFAGALVMRFVPRLRTLFSDAVNIAMMGLAAAICCGNCSYAYEYWLASALVALTALLIGLQCFDSKREEHGRAIDRVFSWAMPLVSIWFTVIFSFAVQYSAGLPSYENRAQLSGLVFLLMTFALAFVFMNVERLRNGVSAVAFPAALMCGAVSLCSLGGAGTMLLGAAGFLLMAVIMLIQNSENGMVYNALRFFHWAPFVCIAGCLAYSITLDGRSCVRDAYLLCAGLLIMAFGLAFRYAGSLGANIRTIFSDIVFTLISLFIALSSFSENSLFSVILSAAASLLILTNIIEKKPKYSWFVLASRWLFPCILTFMSVAACSTIHDATSDRNIFYSTEGTLPENLTFIILMTAMAVCFLRIRKLRTVFSDFFIPIAFTVICFAEMDGARVDICIASMIGMLAICAVLLMYGLEKDGELHQIVHRLAAPFAMCIAVFRFSDLLRVSGIPDKFDIIIACVSGAVAAACAAAVFTGYANSGEDKRFTQSQYAWAALAGALLFPACTDCDPGIPVLIFKIFLMFLAAGIYMLCGKQKRNYFGLLPVIALLTASGGLAEQMAHASKSGLAGTDSGDCLIIVLSAVFIVLCGLSRFVNRENVLVRSENRTAADIAGFAMIAVPFVILSSGGSAISTRWCRFIAVLDIGVIFLNFIRKGHSRTTNLVMITAAAAAGCTLIYVRPFLLTDNIMLSAKINLIPLILFSIIVRIIWKEHKKLASDISFVVQLAAFGVLLFDALTHQSLANTIIVLCVTLTIMFVSFAVKSGRWFAISSASFLGLTIYITRGFVGRVEWWVYLLTAGLVLIAVASVNEYMKSRGQTLKDAGKHFLSRWKKS